MDFVDLLAKSFKSVMLGVDVCSLSESHRLRLSSLRGLHFADLVASASSNHNRILSWSIKIVEC